MKLIFFGKGEGRMTNGENQSNYVTSENMPQGKSVQRIFQAIDAGDEETARQIIVSEKLGAAEIPIAYRKKLLSAYGRYLSFGEFVDEYAQKLGIEYRDYSSYELLKLSSILLEGRGTRVKSNFYLSMYYLARLFCDKYRDQEIYVLNQPSPEEEKSGFEHYLRGSNMQKAKSELQTLADKGFPQAMKPLCEVCTALDDTDGAKRWARLSDIYEPLSYKQPTTTFAAAMQGRFRALEELSRLSDTRYPGEIFQAPAKIKTIIDTWMVRYYENLAYDGYGTALYQLAGYYGDKENSEEEKRNLALACSLGCGFAHEAQYWNLMSRMGTDLISTQKLSESELDQAQRHYEEAVSAGFVRIKQEKNSLKAFRKKHSQYSYQAAASSDATSSGMQAYRKELDRKEPWKNFFLTGLPLKDETIGILGLVTKDIDLMSYGTLGKLARQGDEKRHKEKLIREQLDEERRKDRLSHPAETYSMQGIQDDSGSFSESQAARNDILDAQSREGYELPDFALAEYAESIFCPCCGRKMTGSSERLVCRYCHTFVNVPSQDRELFIRYFNISHLYRQIGSFDEAMEYADLMKERFAGSYEGYWAHMLARYGVVFVEGAYLYHINRMTRDELMYDEDFLKLMEMTEGREKAWYYEMEKDFADTLSEYISKRKKTESVWKRPLILCYSKYDKPACEYVSGFKRQVDPSVKMLDINNLSVGCDIDDEAVVYFGIKSCPVMLMIASSREHFQFCGNVFGRFREFARSHSDRMIISIAVGNEDGIFDGAFKNGALFTDRDPVASVMDVAANKINEKNGINGIDDYFLGVGKNTPGSGLIGRLNQWRYSQGLEDKPAQSSSNRIKKIEIEVKNPLVFNSLQDRLINCFPITSGGQFVIRVEFRKTFTVPTNAELNVYIYDQDENLTYYNEDTMRFTPGQDLYLVTFNQHNTEGTPYLRENCVYYVAFQYGDEWVYTAFYVEESQETRYLKGMAELLDVEVPKDARSLSEEERKQARLKRTRELINRRIKASEPGWKVSACTEKVKKAFKEEQNIGHFAILSPSGRVRSFANCRGREKMIQTSFWQNITDVLCVKSGILGLTKGRFLLYSGTDKRLRDIVSPLRDVVEIFDYHMDYSGGMRPLVVVQPYRALVITPTQVTQINGDYSYGAYVKVTEHSRIVSYDIMPKPPLEKMRTYDKYGQIEGIDRTTGQFYDLGKIIADDVLHLEKCNDQYVWLDFLGEIHSYSTFNYVPIEIRLKKKKAKAIFAYDSTLYGVMPDNRVEVLYGKDELGILEDQNQ